MTDFVKRLRDLADEHKYPLVGWEQRLVATLREAADEITRLQAENEGLTLKHATACRWCDDLMAEREALQARIAELEQLNLDMAGGHIVFGRAMVPAESSTLVKENTALRSRVTRLERAIFHFIETDRIIGGGVPDEQLRELRHFASDSASVADFVAALDGDS